jgi:hypothetical protein
MQADPVELVEADMMRIRHAAAIASEQLKLAKQIVSDGGFAGAGAGPLTVAAVLQAIATNYLACAR